MSNQTPQPQPLNQNNPSAQVPPTQVQPHGLPPYAGTGAPFPGAPVPAPQTGRSWFARHKILTGVGAVAVLAIVVSALGGGGDDGAATASQPGAEAVATHQPTGSADDAPADDAPADDAPAEAAAPGLTFPGMEGSDVVATGGETVTDKDVTVTATTLVPGDATFGPTLCSTVTLVNGASSSLDVNALDFTLQDPNGAISNVGLLGSENHLSASTIISGGTVSGDVCFDADASGGGQYVLLYEPVLQLLTHRVAWVNQL